MAEILFNGMAGRIQGMLSQHGQAGESVPIALILPPKFPANASMDHPLVVGTYNVMVQLGFTAMRINYRGVGKSIGVWGTSDGELNDAAMAIDWLQNCYPTAKKLWIIGFGFGAWISMQLLMRRPELVGFIAVAPPAHEYDFSFLTPCPVSGLILHGTDDEIIPVSAVDSLAMKMRIQKGVEVKYKKIENGDHLFSEHSGEVMETIRNYVASRLQKEKEKAAVTAFGVG